MEPEVCLEGSPSGIVGLETATPQVLDKDPSEIMTAIEILSEENSKENVAAQPGDKTVSDVDVPCEDFSDRFEGPSCASDDDYSMDSLVMPPDECLLPVDQVPLDFSMKLQDKPATDEGPPVLQGFHHGSVLEDFSFASQEVLPGDHNQEGDVLTGVLQTGENVQEQLTHGDFARQETSLKDDIVKTEDFQEEPVGQGKLLQGDTVQHETSQEDAILYTEQIQEEHVIQGDFVQDGFVQPETSQKDVIFKAEYIQEEPLQMRIIEGNSVGGEIVEESRIEPTDEEILVAEPVQISGNVAKEEIILENSENSRSDSPVELNAANITAQEKLSSEQLRNIWELAKKLCEARCAYNQNVCRPTRRERPANQPKKPPAKVLAAHCTRNRAPNSKTNRGVCTIGKGKEWDDPPEWNWGQPLPKEISEAIPSKPAPETPTISLIEDEFPMSSSCFKQSPDSERIGSSPSPKRKRSSPVSKSLKISISVTRFKGSSDPVVLGDSDEELPDFSMELGIPKKMEPSPQVCYDVRTDGESCTVIDHAAPVVELAPTTRLNVKQRRVASENRPPNRTFNPQEIVILESSDSDDGEIEVVQIARKGGPSKAPEKPQPSSKNNSEECKDAWCCPICLETKDKVANIMSTTCGHIFCGPCLQSTIKINKQCPNCRKKLTLRQIHNLYL